MLKQKGVGGMAQRLKSNIKYVWWDFTLSLFGIILTPFGIAAGWIEKESIGLFVFVLVFGLLMFALSVFGLVEALLNWQWVTVSQEKISVRCLFFEIRSIPIAKIKWCWVCKRCLMTIVMRSWNVYRDCIVIDTARKRKGHTIPDGFSSRKHRYIILPDTPENRYVLRQLPEEVRRELL